VKTNAFIIRVAICFLLSQIPVTELEDRIYSYRMDLRGRWGDPAPILILDLDTPVEASLGSLRLRLAALQPAWVYPSPSRPLPQLIQDADGTVRSALRKTKGQDSPAAAAFARLNPEQIDRLARLRDPHLINYNGPAGTFRHCSLRDALNHLCGELRGKILILDTASESPPTFRTPLGEMSQAEIVANDINTVAFRHPIYAASFIERALLSLAMILVSAFYIIYYPVVISAIAVSGTGIAVVIVLFQLIFHFFHVYLPSANVAVAMLITYLIFTGYRLAFQENLQWRSLKQAQYLRELDQMKTNFLSLVSHDLKTPLAKIQAQVERLRREMALPIEQRGADWRESLDSIENSNNELKHYITSILNLSRIESQKVMVNKRTTDLNRLIEQTLKRLRPLATQKGITIEESLEPLFSIECDEDLIRQVLTNLVDNAIKYSPPQSRVIVRSQEEEGFVRVEVEDFGPGIPKDQLPLMFRKFSRYLRPIKEQVKGTGLGLYLSKYFIELHGGTIRLKSVEGQGTTFTFTLPLHGSESESLLS